MKLNVSDRFNVSRATFVFEMFFNDQFNRELHEMLDFKSREILKREEDDEQIRLRIEYMPRRELPTLAKKILKGGELGYVEDLIYHKSGWYCDTFIKPMTLADRIDCVGVMRFLEDGPSHCLRTYEMNVTVNLPLAGGLIAKQMAKDIEESYKKTARFVGEYIRRHKLA
ncbi:MAG: DUF2505 family protein [Myxococcales bacterium]|nr:DUF2505 family protein [Myxococcales bacterium]